MGGSGIAELMYLDTWEMMDDMDGYLIQYTPTVWMG